MPANKSYTGAANQASLYGSLPPSSCVFLTEDLVLHFANFEHASWMEPILEHTTHPCQKVLIPHTWADQLTHLNFAGFNPSLRLDVSGSWNPHWVLLDRLLELKIQEVNPRLSLAPIGSSGLLIFIPDFSCFSLYSSSIGNAWRSQKSISLYVRR